MRKMLQIGEVAQLLGVTPKTLRHYHKVGLLAEPERTEAGYRLYSAQDLARLKRIRHLQSLGLPLKAIRTLLGTSVQEHTLREILQALDAELADQLSILQERRLRIQALLDENTLPVADKPAAPSSFTLVKDLLGERLSTISPEAQAIEENLWNTLDSYHWPAEYRERMLDLARHLAAQPALSERMLAFGKKIATLSSLPEDAPEVDLLLEEYAHSSELLAFMQEITALSAYIPHMASPFTGALGDLLAENLSPAQRRFFAALSTDAEHSNTTFSP